MGYTWNTTPSKMRVLRSRLFHPFPYTFISPKGVDGVHLITRFTTISSNKMEV